MACRSALAESTRIFQACSDAVRDAIGRLESEAHRSDLAVLLKALQAEVRRKLHFTLILMVAALHLWKLMQKKLPLNMHACQLHERLQSDSE